MRQGDSLAPMIFILVTQVVAEAIAVEFKKRNINLPDVKVSVSDESVIRKHKPN